MKLNFHDLQAQYDDYKDEINHSIQEVLLSGQFIMGKAVLEFEEALATFLNCSHVISCGSGTDALLLALLAIDIKPGDEVITSTFSFIAAAEVISLLGAKPIFIDIEEDTYNIDANQIEANITPKTRAILPVSLYGQPADMDKINELAQFHSKQINKKIYVIEDAAQSLGAEFQSMKSGNVSDIGCLSFFPTKPLGCYGDGGAVVVNDDLLAEKIKSLRIHGQSKRYNHKYIGFNCRLDTLQAAILKVKLKYFATELKKRQQIATNYTKLLSPYHLVLPLIKKDRSSTFAQYSIRSKQRNALIQTLRLNNIPTAIHYPKPIHLQECFAYLNYKVGDFPVAECIANEILSLPMSAFITETQLTHITDTIGSFFDKNLISQVS